MLIIRHINLPEFIAGDDSKLKEIFNPLKQNLDLGYSLAIARIKPKSITTLHKLKHSEVYFILKGKGEIYIDDEIDEITEGDTIYIPPHSRQRIKNIGNEELVFLCIVDPAWAPQIEEILGSKENNIENKQL